MYECECIFTVFRIFLRFFISMLTAKELAVTIEYTIFIFTYLCDKISTYSKVTQLLYYSPYFDYPNNGLMK